MVFLHFEDATPEFTLKFAAAGKPLTVREALGRFALAYGGTGYELSVASLSLCDEAGRALAADAVLPCGIAPDADAFVRSSTAPVALPGDARAAAAAAAEAASTAAAHPAVFAASVPSLPGSSAEELRKKGVTAIPGSKAAESQAKFGANSYYYAVGKHRTVDPTGVVTPPVPVVPPQAKAVAVKPTKLAEATITSYSMIDDDDVIKVQVPLAGAGQLEEGAISAAFRIRSFDLRVTHENKSKRMHIPILCQEIDTEKCVVKKKAGKLIVVLKKKKADDHWYELRKTKGVGDSEYNKLIPDDGESTMFTL